MHLRQTRDPDKTLLILSLIDCACERAQWTHLMSQMHAKAFVSEQAGSSVSPLYLLQSEASGKK